MVTQQHLLIGGSLQTGSSFHTGSSRQARLPGSSILLFGILILSFLVMGCKGVEDEGAILDPPAQSTVVGLTAADGVPIAYRSRGTGSPALVFVHGWACNQTYWKHQVAAFADHHRTVTIDLPGHGESGSERQEWSLEGYGLDVAKAVTDLGLDPVILIGHSMGGAVILEAAQHLDERVVGLIGVETFHDAEFQVADEQWQPMLDAYRQDYDGTCRTMVTAMFPQPSELAEEVKDAMCSGSQEVGIALMERFGTYQGAELMASIPVPIRAVNAEHSMPTQTETNRKYSPGFAAVTQEGVGHFLMLEAPERFNELLAQVIDEVQAASAQVAAIEAGISAVDGQ